MCFIKANVACDVFVGGDLRALGIRDHTAPEPLGKLSALLRSNGIKKYVAPIQLKQSNQSSLRMSIDSGIVSNCRYVVFSSPFRNEGNFIRYCNICNLASKQNVCSASIFVFEMQEKENALYQVCVIRADQFLLLFQKWNLENANGVLIGVMRFVFEIRSLWCSLRMRWTLLILLTVSDTSNDYGICFNNDVIKRLKTNEESEIKR